jgi:proline utilization trans-activator
MLMTHDCTNAVLETFLPYDVEFTYAAALHLTLANTVFQSGGNGETYSQNAHSILDDIISGGNKVAEARKGELVRIEDLCKELNHRVQEEGLQVFSLSNRADTETSWVDSGDTERQRAVSTAGTIALPQWPTTDIPQFPAETSMLAHVDTLEDVGISSYEFLSIVSQLDNPVLSYGAMV